jgi:hypothetical protein
MFEANSTRNMTDKSVNGQNCRKSALLSRLLMRHKLNLRSKDKLDLCEILVQYLTQFREVASLCFDIGVFMYASIKGAERFIGLFDDFIASEKD